MLVKAQMKYNFRPHFDDSFHSLPMANPFLLVMEMKSDKSAVLCAPHNYKHANINKHYMRFNKLQRGM